MKLKHRIAHLFGWNKGEVETWRRGDGIIMVGYRCECGELSGIQPANEEVQPWVSGFVECETCDCRWMAVRPIRIVVLECPECGEMTRCREVAAGF